MNKSLSLSLEEIKKDKIILVKDKNFYKIEKTLDIHLIYNREKQNLNSSENLKKAFLIQTQSFNLYNNSVLSESIFSGLNNEYNKNKIYFDKRNSNDTIVYKRKRILIKNNWTVIMILFYSKIE